MQIRIYKKPANNVFSRNPIPFSFRMAPFTLEDLRVRTKLFVAVDFSMGMKAPLWNEVWSGTLNPNAEGLCSFDIADILDAQLEFYTPNRLVIKVHKCKNQCGQFRIRYYAVNGDNLITDQRTTEAFKVYKGGIAKEDHTPDSSYLNDEIIGNGKPLHYYHNKETFRWNEPKWLYFVANLTGNYLVELNREYNSASPSGGTYANTYHNISQWLDADAGQVYCVPVETRLSVVELELGQPATNDLIDMHVQLSDVANNFFLPQNFKLDARPFYDVVFLLYRNSLGALESQPILGELEFNKSIKSESFELAELSNEIGSYKLQSQFIEPTNTHNTPTKANTGWISKAQLTRLTDMLLNREVWQPYGNRLVPISINTKSVTLYKSTSNMYNLQFDYSIAYDDENYSPENLVAFNESCPAVEFLFAEQTKSGKISLFWKLPNGYDKIKIQATGTYTYVPGGATHSYDKTWIINQNTGSMSVDIDVIFSSTNVFMTIMLEARVVCNDENEPFSYGPVNTSYLDFELFIAPVAVDDAVDISDRNTLMRTLKKLGTNYKILSNDIPSTNPTVDFSDFYDASGAVTALSQNGANILFNSSGELEYTPTPTSMAITAQDVIFYKCEETTPVGLLLSNEAKILVPLKGEIPKVYVKRTAQNITTSEEKYGVLDIASLMNVSADIYFQFFKDAAGTIPIDVTTLGLVIGYDEFKEVTPYNSIGTPSSMVGPTYLSSGAYSATGFSMQILTQYPIRHINDLGTNYGAEEIYKYFVFSPSNVLSAGDWEMI